MDFMISNLTWSIGSRNRQIRFFSVSAHTRTVNSHNFPNRSHRGIRYGDGMLVMRRTRSLSWGPSVTVLFVVRLVIFYFRILFIRAPWFLAPFIDHLLQIENSSIFLVLGKSLPQTSEKVDDSDSDREGTSIALRSETTGYDERSTWPGGDSYAQSG